MKIYKDLKYMKERLIVAGLLCLSVKAIEMKYKVCSQVFSFMKKTT